MTWRYHAQRAITNTWLHRDIEIRDVELDWALTGPGSISGTVDAASVGVLAVDGGELFSKWSTLLYAEEDDDIKWGGIVDNISDVINGEITFTGRSFAGYPLGRKYLSDYTKFYETDAFDLIRMLWRLCQEDAYGDLEVVLSGDMSGYIIGSNDPGIMPTREMGETDQEWDARLTTYLTKNNEPYELAWWLMLDFGEEINKIMTEANADFVENHYWRGDKSAVLHQIDLRTPGVGRRRSDLRFVEGENIAVPPLVSDSGEEYANFVVALGAGEERFMLREEASVIDGRLRRDLILPGKNTYSPSLLRQTAKVALSIAQNQLKYDTIEIFDHPNAPLGSWDLGDEIYIQTFSTHHQINDWVRVLGWKCYPQGDGIATLSVMRLT